LSKYSHNKLATVFPTTKDHGKPGSVVTEMLFISFILSRQIWLNTVIIFSLCSLEAISGTTPPKILCSFTCEYAKSSSTKKVFQSKFTIQMDVSSQLVSIAKVLCIFINLLHLLIKNLYIE
jgi:hypothetical protein